MKITNILFLASVLFALSLQANAQKYYTKTGSTEFKASVAAFEPVEATNESTTAILNTDDGTVAALLFINAFKFRVALMEEHFNENYMNSAEFPKASFKGTITDFDVTSLNEEPQEFPLTGSITIKDIEKEVETKVSLKMVNNEIIADSSFEVAPSDFEIEIPSIVKEKIAKSITVIFSYELVKK